MVGLRSPSRCPLGARFRLSIGPCFPPALPGAGLILTMAVPLRYCPTCLTTCVKKPRSGRCRRTSGQSDRSPIGTRSTAISNGASYAVTPPSGRSGRSVSARSSRGISTAGTSASTPGGSVVCSSPASSSRSCTTACATASPRCRRHCRTRAAPTPSHGRRWARGADSSPGWPRTWNTSSPLRSSWARWGSSRTTSFST